MKYTIHTPTADFAYVETEFDDKESAETATGQHAILVGLQKHSPNFPAIVKELADTGKLTNGVEKYESCSKEQQDALQAIKRLIKRNQ